MGIISNLSDVTLVTEDVKKLCQDVRTSSSYVWGLIKILKMKKEKREHRFFHKTLTWICSLVGHWIFLTINVLGKLGTAHLFHRRRVYALSFWFEAESYKICVSFKITFEESASFDHILYSTVLVILRTVHF